MDPPMQPIKRQDEFEPLEPRKKVKHSEIYFLSGLDCSLSTFDSCSLLEFNNLLPKIKNREIQLAFMKFDPLRSIKISYRARYILSTIDRNVTFSHPDMVNSLKTILENTGHLLYKNRANGGRTRITNNNFDILHLVKQVAHYSIENIYTVLGVALQSLTLPRDQDNLEDKPEYLEVLISFMFFRFCCTQITLDNVERLRKGLIVLNFQTLFKNLRNAKPILRATVFEMFFKTFYFSDLLESSAIVMRYITLIDGATEVLRYTTQYPEKFELIKSILLCNKVRNFFPEFTDSEYVDYALEYFGSIFFLSIPKELCHVLVLFNRKVLVSTRGLKKYIIKSKRVFWGYVICALIFAFPQFMARATLKTDKEWIERSCEAWKLSELCKNFEEFVFGQEIIHITTAAAEFILDLSKWGLSEHEFKMIFQAENSLDGQECIGSEELIIIRQED